MPSIIRRMALRPEADGCKAEDAANGDPLASPTTQQTPLPASTRRAGENRARCGVAAPCEVRTSLRRRVLHRIPVISGATDV